MNSRFTPKVIIACLFLFILLLVYGFCAKYADNKINDFFLRKIVSVLKVNADDNVVLVSVDKKSMDALNGKWTRNLYSDIFDFLEYDCGAKVLIFNNVISSPDTYHKEEDKYFFENLAKHNVLVSSYRLDNSYIKEDIIPGEYIDLFISKSPVTFRDFRKLNKYSTDSYKAVINLPYDVLLNAKKMSFSFIPEDDDTIVRMYPPIVFLNDKALPSLALSAYAMSRGVSSFDIYDDYICASNDCETFKMPIVVRTTKDYIGNETKNFVTYIRWFNPIAQNYTHKVYSAIDILKSYNALRENRKPVLSPDLFRNKIVIVGSLTDKNVWDNFSETPVLKKQDVIDVHATMIDNMLANVFKSVKKSDFSPYIAILFSIIIIFGFKSIRTNLIFASILSLLYIIYYFYEYFSCVYFPQLSPIFIVIMVAVLKWIFTVVTVDKNVEMIKRAMGKYITKDVMKTVLKNADKLKPGGDRSNATILFIDIRNFTGISEELNPSDVTLILNQYFSVIEPIIAKYNGVINKYLGDGVLAIFGEPIKNEQHPINAIMCADEILSKVKDFQLILEKENKPKIEVGVGINTGDVFAGNIGTEERLEYTIIGDNVNLAYRIESYNRILKTQFLISEYTYNSVKDKVEVLKLSHVNIKGKSQPIDIYEVLKVKK